MTATHEAFRRAEDQIEKANRGGWTTLDLKGGRENAAKLIELPKSLNQLMQLRRLDLSDNQLRSLPDWLGELTQLQQLDLTGNQIRVLPDWLGQLTQLQQLYLYANELNTLPESVSQLRQLQVLNLSANKLTELPEGLGQLRQLQVLNLSANKLTELPEGLGQLTQLERLDVAANQLKKVPEWLVQLSQFHVLNLAQNQLMTLPEWLGQFGQLHVLDIGKNQLTALPESLGHLTQLRHLGLTENQLTTLPESLSQLMQLEELYLAENKLTALPACLAQLTQLGRLDLAGNQLIAVPDWLGQFSQLQDLRLSRNKLSTIPDSIAKLTSLNRLELEENPLNPELHAAYKEGLDAVMRYLRANAEGHIVLNEAKLILIGEGEVGKSCLLGALRNDPWKENRPTTHGIEINPVKLTDPDTGKEITLNSWDFGGQRVYRPTHQLFFSAPAIYLVVWKPREGPQQGFVKEWIKLVRHREPEAKILVVATHGGPKERQPDIDRQEIWDLFGKDMVLDFFLVESKPDKQTQERKGIEGLKEGIARAAGRLPEIGRKVPFRWAEVRTVLQRSHAAYLSFEDVLKLCRNCKMEEEEAKDFVRVSHRLGHLIHYEHDPALRDIVVLKPDWLTTAISFVLDDEPTRNAHGLVEFSRLAQLWSDQARPEQFRYDAKLHPLFLRLMERFDISYKVAIPSEAQDAIGLLQRVGRLLDVLKRKGDSLPELHYTSLIAQLVPDVRPDPIPGWNAFISQGDQEQSQICRITETKNGQSAAAEGLFFQLIVRLHKYSLGRLNYAESVHWQRGLVLEDDYGARALLEHVGNDLRITVRSSYPEQFLAALTYEVKWLVENFWFGLRCDVMVPCLNAVPCIGLFEVRKLIENKKRNRPEQPCSVCNEWQNIEALLHNAPAARPNPLQELLANSGEAIRLLTEVRSGLESHRTEVIGRFDTLDSRSKELVIKVEAAYTGLMRTLIDEAKDGPRLFSFQPVDPGFFGRPQWISEKFQVTLWCEHSRLPLPALNGKRDKRGVYDLTFPREWIVKAAPFLRLLVGTLSLVVPVAASATKFALDDVYYKRIENELDLGQKSLTSVLKGAEQAWSWLSHSDTLTLDHGEAIRAQGSILRQLQVWLKEKDPSFGGLVRVQNKRQEFLWVHSQFEQEY